MSVKHIKFQFIAVVANRFRLRWFCSLVVFFLLIKSPFHYMAHVLNVCCFNRIVDDCRFDVPFNARVNNACADHSKQHEKTSTSDSGWTLNVPQRLNTKLYGNNITKMCCAHRNESFVASFSLFLLVGALNCSLYVDSLNGHGGWFFVFFYVEKGREWDVEYSQFIRISDQAYDTYTHKSMSTTTISHIGQCTIMHSTHDV